MYICIFVYMYICIYVYMYICIYVYVYIYIDICIVDLVCSGQSLCLYTVCSIGESAHRHAGYGI